MESSQSDETRPTRIEPEGSNLPDTPPDLSELGETRPHPVAEPGLDVTQPSPVAPLPPAGSEASPQPRRRRGWLLWAVLGVLGIALIAAGSGYAGYNSAIQERTSFESTQVAGEAGNQYALALQDVTAGNYDLARQRLEYIIQLDPNYPGAADLLAQVLTQQRITATPTVAPSPTLTPTPDFRGRDDLYNQAQAQLAGREWTGAIDTLLILRKRYPDFMVVQVDGMLFVALRNRGIDKIARQNDLEGGIYDLTLASEFGPLDAEARNWRDWAELYVRGAIYWEVDWAQAVYYFSQLAPAAPNLSDASGWTASNRYLQALLGYGNWLANRGEWCSAQQQFDTYMDLIADPQVEPTAVHAADQCASGADATATPEGFELTPSPTPTETPSP